MNSEITAENMLNILYPQKQFFPYKLVLEASLELPLYRERNFK